MRLMASGLFLMPMGGISNGCFPFDGRALMRKRVLTEISLYVADIAVYVLVATIDPVQLLLKVLVDELVAI